MDPLPFYGEETCWSSRPEPDGCKNKAYYWVPVKNGEGRLSCGVHARDPSARKDLPKRSPESRRKLAEKKKQKEDLEIRLALEANLEAGRQGHVIVSKLRMMKAPPDVEGYLKVFPNFRHDGRTDGLGMSELSPMSLGPVNHTQPGLPPALHIEGLHQGQKCFPAYQKNGKPTKDWYQTRLEMYSGPPKRHHPGAKSADGSKNVPLYSIWVLPDGTEAKLSYVESRQIYCTYYERLATQTKSFKKLKRLRKSGTNLQIIGYDGYDLKLSPDLQENPSKMEKIFEKYYLDGSRPFGHEVVLACLLLLKQDQFPWRKHTTLEL